MTSATAIIRRINRAAAAGRGLRFTPEKADLLRAVLELSEAHAQAHALDADAQVLAQVLDGEAHASTQPSEPGQ